MPNGNQRGNSVDRARRKAWLLSPEAGWGGDGETVPCWECGVLCGPDDVDLFADRIIPCERGGTYRRENIAPHCDLCSHRQGQRATTRICRDRRSAAWLAEHLYLAASPC
ncbi:HNH endonuclease [Mycobacterium phage Rita1961]|nr:HNH endonuclease [Mycobacterium phage Rita1961]